MNMLCNHDLGSFYVRNEQRDMGWLVSEYFCSRVTVKTYKALRRRYICTRLGISLADIATAARRGAFVETGNGTHREVVATLPFGQGTSLLLLRTVYEFVKIISSVSLLPREGSVTKALMQPPPVRLMWHNGSFPFAARHLAKPQVSRRETASTALGWGRTCSAVFRGLMLPCQLVDLGLNASRFGENIRGVVQMWGTAMS